MNIMQDIGEGLRFAFSHLVFLNFILSILIVFFQRKEPKSVWAWLLILYTIPIFGFLLYLLVGTDTHKEKIFRTKEIEDELNEAIRHQEYSIISKELQKQYPDLKGYSDLVYYNLESSGAIFSDDNDITIFTDGNEKFESLLEDLRTAETYIHLQYYIIKDDVLFARIKDVLKEKARLGVEIRILYDGMGGRSVRKKCWDELHSYGIKVFAFFPAVFKQLHLRINYRNHRKIVVIDGKIAYVGGFNIGKEYIGMDDKFGYWRDTHLRFKGTAVFSLHLRFILDWNYASRENLFQYEKYFNLPDKREGDCEVQIISSGPDSAMQNIRNNYLRLICKAEESIYIQTPYFIPDEAILTALTIAIYSGVEVNIMIPCKPDHPFVYWATYSYIGELIMAGANCYTYDNGFLHAKGVIVDGKTFCYGTANMDIRSFQLNFEVNAVVYNESEAIKMEEIFKEDLKYCTQITKELYTQRSLMIRLKEQVSRLLSPLL